MNAPAAFTAVTTTVRPIGTDTVFLALSDPTRRQILSALFDGQPHAVAGMGGSQAKRRDLLRKHCEVLAKSGLILREDHPQDARRSVYQLAPQMKPLTTPEGVRILDFGCCIVRC
ncbi:MAG: helix-turn-helix transcriptional regulator [Verrucomicrobiaceae bacterium]|nr:helix-turn-helix transcriptional regulator [Verrucomicrobiaceae bacterium]